MTTMTEAQRNPEPTPAGGPVTGPNPGFSGCRPRFDRWPLSSLNEAIAEALTLTTS